MKITRKAKVARYLYLASQTSRDGSLIFEAVICAESSVDALRRFSHTNSAKEWKPPEVGQLGTANEHIALGQHLSNYKEGKPREKSLLVKKKPGKSI